MKKDKNKELFFWFFWLVLVILWNYGFPSAKPFYDVLVSSILSIFFIILKKLSNKNLKKNYENKY